MDIASVIKAATAVPKELKEIEKKNKTKNKKNISNSNSNINISSYIIVDDNLIDNIKTKCKKDNSILVDVGRYLLLDLGNNHGVIRLRSLYIINILFIRSNTFRTIISDDIKNIARCAGLIKTDVNVSNLANNYHKEVEAKVKELIELWDISYGSYYPQIHAIARYLRESLHIDMPNIRERAVHHINEISSRDNKAKRIILLRRNRIMTELTDSFGDIQSNMNELEGCFSILFPLWSTLRSRGDDDETKTIVNKGKKRTIWECDGEEIDNDNNGDSDDDDDDDDIDWIDGNQTNNNNNNNDDDDDDDNDLQLTDLGAATHDINITVPMSIKGIENSNNTVLLKTMKELYTHMIIVTIPKAKEWIVVLEKALPLYDDNIIINANTDIISTQHNYEKMKTSEAIDKVKIFLRDAENLVEVRCRPLFEVN